MTKAANDYDVKGQLAELTKEHEALTKERDALKGDLDTAIAAQAAAVAERDDFEVRLKTASDEALRSADANAGIQRERDELAEQLKDANAAHDATKARLAKLEARPRVSRGAKVPQARAAAPMDFDDKNPKPTPRELLDAVREGGCVIVLSDGAHELREIEPIEVTAEAFQPGPGDGLVMTEPVRITPERGITIEGYALLDGKGKQIAWGQPVTPIQVPAGQAIELKREFVF